MLLDMKPIGKSSIHKTMLIYYLTTALSVMAVTTAVFSFWQLGTIRGNIEDSLHQTCRTVALNVDKEIQRMDSVSINVLYSNLVKDTFAEYAGYPGGSPSSAHEDHARNTNAERLINLLYAIMGADQPVRQINLYDWPGGSCFGVGLYTGRIDRNAHEMPWYEKALETRGRKYIPLPAADALLSHQIGASGDKLYFSLTRQFFNEYNKPVGFVEILQYYDVVFATAIDPESNYEPRVIIYNPEGGAVFPANAEDGAYTGYLSSRGDGLVQVKNPLNGNSEYVVFGDMPYSGFSIAVVVESSRYHAPIARFVLTIFAMTVAVAALCIVTAYFATWNLSKPIIGMYSYLRDHDLERYDRLSVPLEDSGILEIDVLRDSIDLFQQRLRKSMDNILLLQKQDMQSRMLALQSQMNPHFLYNSLATVSAMAEEGMTDEIGEMCAHITAILRYISSDKEQFVPLEDELDNTYRYLSCLKLRFGDKLRYVIDIPDDMLRMRVPKLCVQLIVENAVKFTSKCPPPWDISITGDHDGSCWIISVHDNGNGFSEESISNLRNKIEEISGSGLLPSLELDGMGMMNIYIRLYLLCEGKHIFDFGNPPEGGAQVTIGGNIVV